MRVEQFDGLTDQQLIDLFPLAVAEDYAEIERFRQGTGQGLEHSDQAGRSLDRARGARQAAAALSRNSSRRLLQ